jgi:hypothetical protein
MLGFLGTWLFGLETTGTSLEDIQTPTQADKVAPAT